MTVWMWNGQRLGSQAHLSTGALGGRKRLDTISMKSSHRKENKSSNWKRKSFPWWTTPYAFLFSLFITLFWDWPPNMHDNLWRFVPPSLASALTRAFLFLPSTQLPAGVLGTLSMVPCSDQNPLQVSTYLAMVPSARVASPAQAETACKSFFVGKNIWKC